MIRCDKSHVGIDGDAKTILSEFLTLASAVYEQVYVRVYGDKAKERYFDQITLTTLKDEELEKALKEDVEREKEYSDELKDNLDKLEKEQKKLDKLIELKKQLEKLMNEENED